MSARTIGIDVGAETIKAVEITHRDGQATWTRRALLEHHKAPEPALAELLALWDWPSITDAAVTGRLSRVLRLPRVPEKQARATGFRFVQDDDPATLVAIGSHGFSVLELRGGDLEVFRENNRCSQGTGNFLRQLVERFNLDIEAASALCLDVSDPAPLSGRCPVILKTDMTHLANHGTSHARILAGLYDAVAENVQVLVKPALSPRRLALLGGVARSERIRRHFATFAARHGMDILELDPEEARYVDALGCALLASSDGTSTHLPPLNLLFGAAVHQKLERLPAPATARARVHRLSAPPLPDPTALTPAPAILGYDLGSTGAKAVLLHGHDGQMLWHAYRPTNGDPVGAAQALTRDFLDSPWGRFPVLAVGATGSGREIAGSLLMACYGAERVFVLNEIAAHAEGATHYDPRVDTIFEIGGQDAKYIRLDDGRVVDAAMNEACSAGTGSFIEEQGRRFAGVRDVVQLGELALAAADAVSLGQHCSVFMAEIIDEAVAANLPRDSIIAGIYDAVVQNYLNRVKGNRSVGKVIFCQGMPFAADALAAAVARRTGAEVIVPPHPGTIGALGIARLTRRERSVEGHAGLDLNDFLSAEVIRRDHFICKSTKGCGGAGNKCRIERIVTRVVGQEGRFTWGGGCSLYDRGTGRRKLPDLTPDPFREQAAWLANLLGQLPPGTNGRRLAMSDEFMLKGLVPLFATFFAHLGYQVEVTHGADQKILKRGIEEANIPFCAPMQLFHGVVSTMVESGADVIFVPMLLSTPAVRGEGRSVLCPMVQGAADLNRWDLAARGQAAQRLLSPVIDFQPGAYSSDRFRATMWDMAHELGVPQADFGAAFDLALLAQHAFEEESRAAGRRALEACKKDQLIPVVVLGRTYTIYNQILNSNVPTILREQGAVAIPVDCYPVDDDVPLFDDMYWGYGQRNLRAAHQIRRTPGVYSMWCSNYACGPDSFTLHLYAYAMEGKPYAVIETDGHSGDAGTRTRVEAFLHCLREDLATPPREQQESLTSLSALEAKKLQLDDVRRTQRHLLIPRLGPGAAALAAALRGFGISAEALPLPDRNALEIGRRHTSGKECVPLCLTLGSLLDKINNEPDPQRRFAFLMPGARGPCRFGVYNQIHKLTIERLGLEERVQIWSPKDDDYFEGIPAGITVLVFAGIMTADLLLAALYDVRPAEREDGAALRCYEAFVDELEACMASAGAGDLSVTNALSQVATGNLFGCGPLLRRAAEAFAAIRKPGELPTVLVVGEIYVRSDPFSNDFVIDRLQAEGTRVRLAPFHEWLDYQEFINTQVGIPHSWRSWFSAKVQAHIQRSTTQIMARALLWPPAARAQDSVEAAAPYVRFQLEGEAALTLGGAIHEWEQGGLDGVLSVAPLECMPSKVAEAHFFHTAERHGLYALTLALTGDPVDQATLDTFVYQVRRNFRTRSAGASAARVPPLHLGANLKRAWADFVRGIPQ